MKKIKIVIWDMDDTFWHGTLSEGEIKIDENNIAMIKSLVDRGIMNSISSKNDFHAVKKELEKIGIWDLFIFPCINWAPKGQQIKKMLEDCSLRAENALFLDDNEMNLKEVAYYNPGIHVCHPDNFAKENGVVWDLSGNDDPNHARLQQYKVLETKQKAAAEFSSNYDFLMASNIRVRINKDCFAHFDRLLDLIARSNQLNYTKVRLKAEELDSLLRDTERETGYVQVEDDFGEYGIVGFYSIRNGIAEHFLFSCRTIGMGIEQYVYAKLGYPKIHVVGEVRSQLSKESCPEWINQETAQQKASSTDNKDSIHKKLQIRISGGCDLEQLAAYLKAGNSKIDYKFNVGHIRHDNTSFWCGAKKYSEQQKQELADNLPFIKQASFDKEIYNSKYDIVVISLLMDYTQAVYKNKTNPEIVIAHGDFKLPICKEDIPEYFSAAQADYLRENFDFIGRIPTDDFYGNLCYIREQIPSKTALILINGCEVPHENKVEAERYLVHREYNDIVDRFVDNHENTYLLDMRKIVTERAQLSDNIRHYNRDVYYQMSSALAHLMNEIGNSNIAVQEKTSFIWKYKKLLQKAITKYLKK